MLDGGTHLETQLPSGNMLKIISLGHDIINDKVATRNIFGSEFHINSVLSQCIVCENGHGQIKTNVNARCMTSTPKFIPFYNYENEKNAIMTQMQEFNSDNAEIEAI